MQDNQEWIEDAVNRFRKGCQDLRRELADAAEGTFLDASDEHIMNKIEPLLREIQQEAIQEAIENAQTQADYRRCPKCKKKRDTKALSRLSLSRDLAICRWSERTIDVTVPTVSRSAFWLPAAASSAGPRMNWWFAMPHPTVMTGPAVICGKIFEYTCPLKRSEPGFWGFQNISGNIATEAIIAVNGRCWPTGSSMDTPMVFWFIFVRKAGRNANCCVMKMNWARIWAIGHYSDRFRILVRWLDVRPFELVRATLRR